MGSFGKQNPPIPKLGLDILFLSQPKFAFSIKSDPLKLYKFAILEISFEKVKFKALYEFVANLIISPSSKFSNFITFLNNSLE